MRLASEAYRISLAHLFDPYLAVHTSSVEPLPHQISAVYQEMLPKLPLRYVLADDPGAGKTIMTGLFIKELIVRGDLKRCLIVSPGSLAEQWQDELFSKFHLRFEILTNDRMESAASGNIFSEVDFCICRLDKLARNEAIQEKLKVTEGVIKSGDSARASYSTPRIFFSREISLKLWKKMDYSDELTEYARYTFNRDKIPGSGKLLECNLDALNDGIGFMWWHFTSSQGDVVVASNVRLNDYVFMTIQEFPEFTPDGTLRFIDFQTWSDTADHYYKTGESKLIGSSFVLNSKAEHLRNSTNETLISYYERESYSKTTLRWISEEAFRRFRGYMEKGILNDNDTGFSKYRPLPVYLSRQHCPVAPRAR